MQRLYTIYHFVKRDPSICHAVLDYIIAYETCDILTEVQIYVNIAVRFSDHIRYILPCRCRGYTWNDFWCCVI